MTTVALQMALDRKKAGQELAKLRELKRLTQWGLVEAIGVDDDGKPLISLRQIQRYEGGESMPRYKNLDRLAGVLGDDVYRVVAESGTDDVPADTPDLMGSLNGDSDVAQINKRLQAIETEQRHIRRAIEELVKWSQGGPTRKELESRINALADLAAETLGGQRRLHAQLLEQSLDEEHPDRTAEEHSLAEGPPRAREAG